jgi:hypothetical protein
LARSLPFTPGVGLLSKGHGGIFFRGDGIVGKRKQSICNLELGITLLAILIMILETLISIKGFGVLLRAIL